MNRYDYASCFGGMRYGMFNIGGILISLIFIGTILILGVMMFKAYNSSKGRSEALKHIEMLYANGDISEEELKHRKSNLTKK